MDTNEKGRKDVIEEGKIERPLILPEDLGVPLDPTVPGRVEDVPPTEEELAAYSE